MSYQTTMARAQAQADERAWKAHKTNCATCARGTRSSAWCADGQEMAARWRQSADNLRAQRALDKQPIEGEQPLWT